MTTVKKTKKKRTRKSKPSEEDVWSELVSNADMDNIQNYAMADSYEPNSAIEHPKFGVGIVTEVFHNKMDVVFKDGSRTLVHSRT